MTIHGLEQLSAGQLQFLFRLLARLMQTRRERGDDGQARFWYEIARAVEAALDGETPELDFEHLLDRDVRVAAGVVQGLAADKQPRTAAFFREVRGVLETESRRRKLEVRQLETLWAA